MKKLLICLLIFAASSVKAANITTLRTEGMNNPMGIGTNTPRFGWVIESTKHNVMQSAYRVLVASSPEVLAKGEGDLWDSGKVLSDQSQWIDYKGVPLKSNQRVWWKIESFTNCDGEAWSEPALFSVGLLKENHWRGQWIGLDAAAKGDSETQWSRLSARYLRKEFNLKKSIKSATAHIAGLGMYELFINGQRVGDQVLAPVPTDYRKTITYNSFDVTNLLKQSGNAVAVTLGNGRFYTMRQNYKQYKITNFGYPKLRMNIIVDYSDGSHETISTDTSWKLTASGPIRSNNEYDGEEYDANMQLGEWTKAGYNDSSWNDAQRVSIPMGTLRAATTPNMKIVNRINPVSIKRLGNNYILDMGQNMAGWIKMNIRNTHKGDTIRLKFAETLKSDGSLYIANLRDARTTDTYICNGSESNTEWSPSFVYHGFRFVEISGYNNPSKSDFVGEVVSDEMDNIGTFASSNETLNKVYHNAWWGILANYKGMPVDCPQRNERQPWLGDRTNGCWGESYIFNNSRLYSKWSNDIEEAQHENGSIPDVAPAFWNYYSDNVTWPAALPMACDMVYTQFGDKEPMLKHYNAIKKWLQYMREEYMNSEMIITKDKYGDWCVPPESLELIHSKDPVRQTDGSLLATAYYLKMLQTMHRFAEVLGYDNDKEEWKNLEHAMKDAFNRKFLVVKENGSMEKGAGAYYGNNTATANLLPLAFGLVPQQYISSVSKHVADVIMIKNNGHICCGVIGVQWIMRELTKRGYSDIAYKLATNKTYPSWGYMAENGATTTWELWNGNTANPAMNSGNHVMLLGDLVTWMYENIGGIKSDRKQIGFKKIIMKPSFQINDLKFADASYITPYGKVVSKWKKNNKKVEWDVEIPANTTATITLPDSRVENIGSGKYHFSVKIK